ncbi:MAG: hypothetical protein KKF56_05360 [Nanoarchaeota archaeon]|nr:hypothetical protein [Nanoarchaeota archaeon]
MEKTREELEKELAEMKRTKRIESLIKIIGYSILLVIFGYALLRLYLN